LTQPLEVKEIVKKAKAFEAQEKRAPRDKDDDVVAIHTDKVQMEKAREAGPVYVGCQFWKKLKMDEILKEAGFSEKVRLNVAYGNESAYLALIRAQNAKLDQFYRPIRYPFA